MIIDACILKMISYPPNRLQHLPKPTLDKLLGYNIGFTPPV